MSCLEGMSLADAFLLDFEGTEFNIYKIYNSYHIYSPEHFLGGF